MNNRTGDHSSSSIFFWKYTSLHYLRRCSDITVRYSKNTRLLTYIYCCNLFLLFLFFHQLLRLILKSCKSFSFFHVYCWVHRRRHLNKKYFINKFKIWISEKLINIHFQLTHQLYFVLPWKLLIIIGVENFLFSICLHNLLHRSLGHLHLLALNISRKTKARLYLHRTAYL